MNKKYKFILKRLFFLILLIVLEIILLNFIFSLLKFEIDKHYLLFLYIFLILPTILIYTIVILLSKLAFNRFKLRKGNKFQTRLIISFVIISLIPIIPLGFLTNNLINRSMEIWLTKSNRESLENGLNFALNMYNYKKSIIKHHLLNLSKNNVIRNALIFGMNKKYKKLINLQVKKSIGIDSLFILDKDYNLIYELQTKKLIKKIFRKNILNKLDKNSIYIIDGKNKENNEYLLGYAYVYDSILTKKILGILIIGNFLPTDFSQKINKIERSLQAYKQMDKFKVPIIKGFATLIMIIFSLIIFLISIIISYFLSKNITDPIKVLLDGTKRIVAGDLNFEIKYQAKDEIKLLINAFNHMTRELQASKQALAHSQRLAAWRDIARRIAHEIKNPLTPIRLSIERLIEQKNKPNFKDILDKSSKIILEEVNRLELLIREFSEFAKTPQLKLEIKNLNHIVLDTITIFSGIKNIVIKPELEKDLPMLNLDEKRMKEVLINLINNSIDAIGNAANGQITIRTYSKVNIFGKFVYLEIEDNGRGIKKEDIYKIFDPYFTTKKEGTGLGLAIVEKIINEHQARIKCESEPKKGTKFIIEFTV